MVSVLDKIHSYGQKRDQKSLELCMITIDEDELINLVKQRIHNANFTETWNYLLKSFRDSPECHRKRLKLVLCVLKEMEEKDIPPSRTNTIVDRLCLELTKFTSNHLAKLCSYCLECIHSKKTSKMGWKDLLPELLNVLVEREVFTYDELDYTGLEYKTDFINTLCMTPWSPNIVTPLTAVFIEMPLTKEEHLKIVNKLGSYIQQLTPQEIPAFVYQMLKLCKQQNGRSIFLRLQSYFGLRIYSNSTLLNDLSSESNSPNLDIIESTANQDTIEAESTVLFHIHNAAALGHECIRDYLNSMKNLLKAPEFVLHPFQLMVLFTISTVPHYEETVFEIIRPSIVRSYNEEQRKSNSCWFKEMVPSNVRPPEVLSQVVHFCLQDRDSLLPALVNFSFVLLGVGSALGRDAIAEKQWNLGNMILLKIIKRKRLIALTILQTFCNHIVTRSSVTQYIESLYILTTTLPLLMLENQSCIVELIDCLVQVSGPVANQLLDAIIPLTKVSPTIRDHLIILLRKALYSKSIATRQMAVNGFLKLIKNLKISNLASLSQSSNSTGSFSSGHSLFTQISMTKTTPGSGSSTFSNEALCLEVLSNLRRCFMQQAEVRSQLYEGLYEAVCMNPELGIPVLDVIWFHFSTYYVMDQDQVLPLNYQKIVAVREVESVLQEPLGKLIYTIGLITTKLLESEDERENNTVVKFKAILESLCQRMQNCELVHFELDDGTDLLDVLPESQTKMLILKEAMAVYESLIGYKIYSWNEQSEDQGRAINGLFQGYSRLLHFSKTLSKPKKAESKKKKKTGNNKTTQQTEPPTQQANASTKGQKSRTFKGPDTVLDFQTVKKCLSLLHEPKVAFATTADANVVKTKREFHQHIMQAAIHLVQNVKRRKDIDSQTKKLYFDHITDVAAILYHRIIKRLNEFIDFDCTTAVLAMECLNTIFSVIINLYKSNWGLFLKKVVDGKNDGTIAQLTILVETYEKLLEIDEEETSDDPEIKKMSLIVVNTLGILSSQIPSDNNALAVQISEWLKNYAYNNTVPAKVSTSFINLLFETHIKYKVSLTLLEHISVGLGDTIGVITEDEHEPEGIKVINEATAYNILLSLCSSIKSVLEDVDSVIVRLKCENYMLSYPGAEHLERKKEDLKMKERGICCQVCFVVAVLTHLSNLLTQPGNISEAIFKSIMLVFVTLTSLTKHFIMRSSKVNLAFQGARFERLVKLAGKQLAPAVYKFIMHIEESQKQETEASQAKKKSVDLSTLKSRVLRETRLIPKVVYELEQFSKCVIQLSNKTKVDLSKYVGQGTVRDFRILKLKEVLGQADGSEAVQSTQSSSVTASEVVEVEDENSDNNEEIEEEDDTEAPPSKKSKR